MKVSVSVRLRSFTENSVRKFDNRLRKELQKKIGQTDKEIRLRDGYPA